MIVQVSGADRKNNPALFEEMFRLRHRVFVETRRWSLATRSGLEIDEYDVPEAQYFFERGQDGRMISHVRALPASRSLLADYFPHLVEIGMNPRDPHGIETTRLYVDRTGMSSLDYRRAKAELLLAIFEWASGQGATHLQTVIENSLYGSVVEMLPQTMPLGLAHPYGGGPGTVGGGDTIALKCPVNHQAMCDLRRFGELLPKPCDYCLEQAPNLAA